MSKLTRRSFIGTGLATVGAGVVSKSVQADDLTYPVKTVTIVNPFAPGSISDAAARIVSQSLQDQFGQPFVVENKVGGGGLLAGNSVARANPDGYTLLLTASSSFSGAALYKSLPYDPVKDFTHVARIGCFPCFIAVHPSVPAKTIQEFVAYAKANPAKLSYGHGNNLGQIVGEILKRRTGIELVRVPYRSAPAGVIDLIAGQIQMMVPDFNTGLPQAQAGTIVALAMATKERSPSLPNVPTLHETVMPGFEILPWCGLSAPPSLPQAITQKLALGVEKALADATIQKRLAAAGVELFGGGPEIFQAYVKEQLDNWTALIKDAGIEPTA